MGWGRKIAEEEELRAWVRSGRPFKPWDRQPRLRPHLDWIRRAFDELLADRRDGRIPWASIQGYAEAHGADDVLRFHRLIRACEQEFQTYLSQREKRTVTRKAPRHA